MLANCGMSGARLFPPVPMYAVGRTVPYTTVYVYVFLCYDAPYWYGRPSMRVGEHV